MTLDELLDQLKNLTYKDKSYDGRMDDYHVISQRHFDKVEQLVRQYALDNHDAELGELQAKVYAYEQIIAKSNFAPMLSTPVLSPTIQLANKPRVNTTLTSTTDVQYNNSADEEVDEYAKDMTKFKHGSLW